MARVASLFLSAALLVSALGCVARPQSGVVFQGDIVDEIVKVTAPPLPAPVPEVEVGLGDVGAAGGGAGGPIPATSASNSPIRAVGLGSVVRVEQVLVAEGDRVRAGDVLARFDEAMLAGQVKVAEADLAYANARSRSLRSRRTDVKSAQDTIAANQARLTDTVAQLRSTRARLVRQLGTARSGLAQLLLARKRLESALAQLPPGGLPPGVPVPTGTPDPSALRAQLAQVNAQIARVRSGIARLQAGIAKIDAGLAKAGAGESKLRSARSKAASARAALNSAVELSDLAVSVSETALAIARQQLALAALKSPVDGVVVEAPAAGEAMAPGAAAFTLRADAVSRARTYLSVEQARRVRTGGRALVSADWLDGPPLRGRVTLVGAETVFPPTTLSTAVIHLVRGVPVEVSLDSARRMPPGTPVDLSFERK